MPLAFARFTHDELELELELGELRRLIADPSVEERSKTVLTSWMSPMLVHNLLASADRAEQNEAVTSCRRSSTAAKRSGSSIPQTLHSLHLLSRHRHFEVEGKPIQALAVDLDEKFSPTLAITAQDRV